MEKCICAKLKYLKCHTKKFVILFLFGSREPFRIKSGEVIYKLKTGKIDEKRETFEDIGMSLEVNMN